MSSKNRVAGGRIRGTGERHLVLVDVENIAGKPCPTDLDLDAVQAELLEVIPDLSEAQCIVACSHIAAKKVAFAFPGARRRWRSGPDGADLALIEEMNDLRVMGQFGRVTLCSGDGIFTESLSAVAALGIETTVVSVETSLSRRLGMAAHRTVTILGPDTTPESPVLKEAS